MAHRRLFNHADEPARPDTPASSLPGAVQSARPQGWRQQSGPSPPRLVVLRRFLNRPELAIDNDPLPQHGPRVPIPEIGGVESTGGAALHLSSNGDFR
jgi:hypothetical protein